MKIMNFDYEKAVLAAFALNREDFSNLQIWLEQENARCNTDFLPWEVNYKFPRKDASLRVTADKVGQCVLELFSNGERYSLGDVGRNPKEIHELGVKIKDVMDSRHLNFCPRYPEEFRKEVAKADVGTVIVLNTKRAITCTERNGRILQFKDCFAGDLKDLKIESFENGPAFEVDLDDYDSMQNLFEAAYTSRSLTANIRVSIASSHGAYAVTDIENATKQNSVKKVHVGPIYLRIRDFDGEKVWYDNKNHRLNRETVVNLFGWAHLSIPEITINRNYAFLDMEKKDAAFIQDVQELTRNGNYREIAIEAMKYAKDNHTIATLNITGLKSKVDGSFDLVTYGFSDEKIIRFDYDKQGIPCSETEISLQEFISFCEEKYKENVEFLETEYTSLVSEYRKTHPEIKKDNSEIAKNVAEYHAKYKSPLIREDDVGNLTEAVMSFVEDAFSLDEEK